MDSDQREPLGEDGRKPLEAREVLQEVTAILRAARPVTDAARSPEQIVEQAWGEAVAREAFERTDAMMMASEPVTPLRGLRGRVYCTRTGNARERCNDCLFDRNHGAPRSEDGTDRFYCPFCGSWVQSMTYVVEPTADLPDFTCGVCG
jgi:hypothetical protein